MVECSRPLDAGVLIRGMHLPITAVHCLAEFLSNWNAKQTGLDSKSVLFSIQPQTHVETVCLKPLIFWLQMLLFIRVFTVPLHSYVAMHA
jgi:hypothetical protein